QSLAVLGRTMVAAGGYVAADHLADRFGLLPADITLMGVRHQRQPVAACFAADLHLDTGPIVARHDGRLTIGIGTAVDGVLDPSVDGGVVWTPPSRLAVPALHRQIQVMLEKPKQSLSCAAELQDFATRHISISCCQSRLLRANRETSRAATAPTLPRQTCATIRSKPARWMPPAAERPRSSSITSISDQPSVVRRSRMAYCSALLSRLCRT